MLARKPSVTVRTWWLRISRASEERYEGGQAGLHALTSRVSCYYTRFPDQQDGQIIESSHEFRLHFSPFDPPPCSTSLTRTPLTSSTSTQSASGLVVKSIVDYRLPRCTTNADARLRESDTNPILLLSTVRLRPYLPEHPCARHLSLPGASIGLYYASTRRTWLRSHDRPDLYPCARTHDLLLFRGKWCE
jgi:hypothetical protein